MFTIRPSLFIGLIYSALSIAPISLSAQNGNNSGVTFTSSPGTSVLFDELYSYPAIAIGSSNNNYTFTAPILPNWLTFIATGSDALQINTASLNNPSAIAVDANENSYVAEYGTGKIIKITAEGEETEFAILEPMAEYGEPNAPYITSAIIVGNYLYMTDGHNPASAIIRFDITQPHPTQEIIGTGNNLRSLIYRDGYFYTVALGSRIHQIDASTFEMTTFFQKNSEDPDIVAIDFTPDGVLLAASYEEQSIRKYENGSFVIVASGIEDHPTAINVGADGAIYLARWEKSILKFAPDFSSSKEITSGGFFTYDMDISPSGNLQFVSEIYNSGAYKIVGKASFSGIPGPENIGDHQVKLVITDGTTTKEQEFTITVLRKEITVSLINNLYLNKLYDGNDNIILQPGDIIIYGANEGDDVQVIGKGKYNNKHAGEDKEVIVNSFELTGEQKERYIVSEEQLYTQGSINAVPLIISAENKTKKQGKQNPEFTLSYSGFVGEDQASDLEELAQINTIATEKSPIGYYDINVEGAVSGDYIISYEKGRLTVVPNDNKNISAWSSQTTMTVNIMSKTSQKSTISLFTELGQVILVKQQQLQPGVSTISFPITQLTRGIYIINVNAAQFNESQRVKIK